MTDDWPRPLNTYFRSGPVIAASSRSIIRRLLLCASWQSIHDPLTEGTCCRSVVDSVWQAEQIFSFGMDRLTLVMSP